MNVSYKIGKEFVSWSVSFKTVATPTVKAKLVNPSAWQITF